MDIAYIAKRRGCVCLALVLDWPSRWILASQISFSPITDFCLETVEGPPA